MGDFLDDTLNGASSFFGGVANDVSSVASDVVDGASAIVNDPMGVASSTYDVAAEAAANPGDTLGAFAHFVDEVDVLPDVSEGMHTISQGVNYGADWLEAQARNNSQALVEATAGIPVLEQVGQGVGFVSEHTTGFIGGVGRGVVQMGEGIAHLVDNPAQTALGIGTLAYHAGGAQIEQMGAMADIATGTDPEQAMKALSQSEHSKFNAAAGMGFIAPIKKAWDDDRYGDAAGQVAVQIAALASGAGEGGVAAEAAEVAEIAEVAEVAELAEVAEVAELAEVAEVAELAEVAEVAELAEVAEVAEVAEMAEVAEAAEMAEVAEAAEMAEVAEAAEMAEVAEGAEMAEAAEAAEMAEGAEAAEAAEAADAAEMAELDPMIEVHEIDPGVGSKGKPFDPTHQPTPEQIALDEVNWPPNDGGLDAPSPETLDPGTKLHRYGKPRGYFMSPENTPVTERAFPGEFKIDASNPELPLDGPMVREEYFYEVGPDGLRVDSQVVAPAYNESGGGVQYLAEREAGAPRAPKVAHLQEQGLIEETQYNRTEIPTDAEAEEIMRIVEEAEANPDPALL